VAGQRALCVACRTRVISQTSSGRCWSRCSTLPANADRDTARACARSSTRCSTSPTPDANGGISPRRLGPGPGCGHSFAAGRATAPGRERWPRRTRPQGSPMVAPGQRRRWWSSTPISPAGRPTARAHVPRPRRPLRPHQGRQADGGSRPDRTAGGCSGRSGLHPREQDHGADAAAPDRARCQRPTRAGPGRSRGHRGRGPRAWPGLRPGRLAKSFENTTTSATGWLQVACIATTLRHLPRAGAHRPARAPAA
jgi:hypothetical protein